MITQVARCRRSGRIAQRLLDGREPSAADRAHMAGCGVCSAESRRVAGFLAALPATASDVAEGIPSPTPARATRRLPAWIARGRQPVLGAATVAMAVAVGLVVASVIAPRAGQPSGRSLAPLADRAAAVASLESLGLACGSPVAGVTTCRRSAAGRVEQVVLETQAAGTTTVAASAHTDGRQPFEVAGVAAYLSGTARSVLSAEAGLEVERWLRAVGTRCGGECTTTRAGVAITLDVGEEAVKLVLATK